MWDRIKEQAKGFQQARGTQGSSSPAPAGSGGTGGPKGKLVDMLKSQLGSAKTELQSGSYRDASMAMCALVAAADGSVDPAERQHVESLILQNDVLLNFPTEQLRQLFNKHVSQMAVNFQQGKDQAMQEIVKVAKKPSEAKAVVQTGVVIAGADGYVSQAELQILREVCSVLNLAPQEFGL